MMSTGALTTIEAFGSTNLVEDGVNYYFYPNTGSLVELSYSGAPVVAGQFDQFGGHWVPIGAEQTTSGYVVAWKITGADQFQVWNTDSSGNFVASSGVVSGTSAVLESFEPSFQQDLNGDGVLGLTTNVIENTGSTSLEQDGSNYFLHPTGGLAVELSYQGVHVEAGQFDQFGGHWVPIGAEQTANGYEVAWKITGADQFQVWNTDSSGNFVASSGVVSGTSAVLESFERSFQQDLNGDGVLGLNINVIENTGSTSLGQLESNYFLYPNGQPGPAVELSFQGAPVEAGQFDQLGGPWALVGAEQTTSGYVVAWKVIGGNQYEVWNTDNNGNFSSSFGVVSGTSAVLESFETSFQQDLNGDGVISAPPILIESFGSTSLAEDAGNYFLHPNGGSSIELNYRGTPVDGQFDQFGSPWVAIAAEQTSNGYEVAWKIAGADQYTVWFTDSNGNYISSAFDSASGSSTALQSFETSFQQDLNGDGVIAVPGAPPPTLIESFGSTSLAEDAGNYILHPNGGSSIELNYGGATVLDGQFDQFGGHWVPIAAEQTTTGYEVAWKIAGVDQYTVWFTDNSGNYISSAFDSAAGSSTALQSFETSFQQDLNGDGLVGVPGPPPPTVIESFGSTSLEQDGSNYILHPNSGASNELSYGGAPVVNGQFDQFGGHWVPIAAEQTASGYEVAWKIAGADQYTVWFTDSNGNYISSAFDSASGSSTALQSFETSFQQDLNGDGVIAVPGAPPPTVIESFGSTSLAEDAGNYILHPNGGSSIELSYGGAPVVDGQFDQFGGHWVPIAAEQTTTGYEVAWKIAGADQYTVWYTDNSWQLRLQCF